MKLLIILITVILSINLNGLTTTKLTEIKPNLDQEDFYLFKNNLIIIEEGFFKKNIELRQYYFDINTSKMSKLRSVKLGLQFEFRGIYPRNLNQVIINTWENDLFILDFETKKILPIDKKIINNDMEGMLLNGVIPEIDSYFVIRKINHGISITLLNLQSYKKEERIFINPKIDEDYDLQDFDYYNNSIYLRTTETLIECSLRDNSLKIQDINHDIITSHSFYLPNNSVAGVNLNLESDCISQLCIADLNKDGLLTNINWFEDTLIYTFIYDRVNLKILAITMGDKKYNVYMLSDIYKSPRK